MLLEDYGLIGDMESAALVGRTGAVDWLCLPRFDSASCFSALLGDERHGRWLVAPAGEVRASSRRYRPGTLVLETDLETSEGAVRLIDFMPRRAQGPPRVMRIVEGLRGHVPMRMELSLRPDYGSIRPWIELAPDGAIATAGPDAFRLSTPLPLQVDDGMVIAEFAAVEGARERLTLTWHLSYEESPPVEDADSALARTETWWREWSGRCSYQGAYRDEVLTSLIALKAMTSETTGAVIAAPTTSLPEEIGGERNWDYRYSWPRDSAFVLRALLALGCGREARAFFSWLLHASQLTHPEVRVLYRLNGAIDATEESLPLAGYRGSRPVRVGNGAATQTQLDVYGEVLEAAAEFARFEGGLDRDHARRLAGVVDHVCNVWSQPDAGIWEVRSDPAHFTQSKMMCAVALDRALALADDGALRGDTARWRRERARIREFVETNCYSEARRSYVRTSDEDVLDASLLLGVLGRYDDPRSRRFLETVDAVRRELAAGPLVRRYEGNDGVAGEDGAFVACSFWLVEAYARQG